MRVNCCRMRYGLKGRNEWVKDGRVGEKGGKVRANGNGVKGG